ncbi:hypothetical protein [Pedobacter metabolipauper]|uniref:DUF1351 domain-containing protein n=1 Tax=Pedobacter metabolipauper TaxID=425513 RepID=A0A4R6T1F3_9SPHI|nr:hypothetical protein [Pedobacter metabolipauper]TDQ12807.1 hypothetical protein ATK78_0014 [Pedobacter metabolipauper]
MSEIAENPPVTQELIKVEEVTNVILSGLKTALPYNQKLNNLAVSEIDAALTTIEGEGMSDELDLHLNGLQLKCKKAVGVMQEKRMPGTQMMDKTISIFTGLENDLKPSKTGKTRYDKIQALRDQWATKKANDKRIADEKILKEQNIEKEKISIRADIQTYIRKIFNEKLAAFKTSVQTKYNSLTIDTLAEVTEKINQSPILYPIDAFRKLEPSLFPVYLDKETVDKIVYEEREALYDELSAMFRENMEVEKSTTLELLPSRMNELKAIAKAGAEDKKRLEAEAETRRIANENRLKLEQAEQAKKDATVIQGNVNMATASTLFDTTAKLAEVKEASGKSKVAEKITITSTEGCGALYLFYFEKEGKGLSVEDLLKKTGIQMKAFAEKHALKTGEKIDNPAVIYDEEVKAVTSKTV